MLSYVKGNGYKKGNKKRACKINQGKKAGEKGKKE